VDRPGFVRRSWPITLEAGPIRLRPLRLRDGRAWRSVRTANAAWLAPWEATPPVPSEPAPRFGQMVRRFSQEARAGRMLPFVIDYQGRLAGQINVAGITWGSLRSASIGYWVDQDLAGRGIVPTAVALVSDYCFFEVGLHRVELNIRPENQPSLRVAHKLGFRPEGIRKRFLHIDGDWRDHASFALNREEVPGGLLARWVSVSADLSPGLGLTSPAATKGAPQQSHQSQKGSAATHR